MTTTVEDVKPAAPSSEAAPDATATSSVANDATADSSPAGASQTEETFEQKVERHEREALPQGKAESPTTTAEEEPETEAAPETTADNDEPAEGTEAESAPDDLSKQADEVLTQQFAKRAEWQKALALVPKEKQKEMRGVLRDLMQREQAVLDKYKPAAERFEHFKRTVGDDEAVTNTIALTELFQKGDPKALEMLDVLRDDLNARLGNKLTDPTLLKRETAIKQQYEDGLISSEDYAERMADLKELQRVRVSAKQQEQETTQSQQAQRVQQFQQQQTELTNACDAWEKNVQKADPDYPSLKSLVEQRAFVIGNDRQQKLAGRLLNGAEMKTILDEALTWAKAEAARLSPAPKSRVPFSSKGSSATSRRAPSNPKERFEQTVERYEANL